MSLFRAFSRAGRITMPQSTPAPSSGYLVGGAVRDALLGRAVRDLDWLVVDPALAAQELLESLRSSTDQPISAFVLDPERGHWRVAGAGLTVDFTPLRGSLEADLRQRDFTINAMAAELDGTLIDPLKGRADLRRRRLRMSSAEALVSDPIRPLRGVRLAAELGFELEPDTRAVMVELAAGHARGAALPAWERIGAEFDAILRSPAAARGIALALHLGMLDSMVPELAAGRGVQQGGLHHLDVAEHGVEALRQLLLGFPEADIALRWATLLHDVGKPASEAVEADQRIHFYGHASLGATLTRDLLRRLRQPQATRERAAALVRAHMLPLPRDERSARRFVHRRGPLLPDLLRLMLADREAARGPLSSEAGRQAYRIAVSRVLAVLAQPPATPPLRDGDDVMRLLGLEAGPRVGEALRLLAEAVAVGDVHTADEADALLLAYARRQGWLAEP